MEQYWVHCAVQPGGALLPPAPSVVFLVSCPCNHPGRHGQEGAGQGSRPCCTPRADSTLHLLKLTHRRTHQAPLDAIATSPIASFFLPFPSLRYETPYPHHIDRSLPRLLVATITNNGRCHRHVDATGDLGGSVLRRGLHEARSFFQLCKRVLLFNSVMIIVFCFSALTSVDACL